MASISDKVSLKGRLSYGMLDVAGNMAYGFSSAYILYYFTDVAGLAVAAVGTLLLLSRIIDGVDAPIWGIIIDKTHSKYGKCRPWFLWLPIPFALLGTAVFYSPDTTMDMKILYAGITYLLFNIFFTGLNTPLTAILPLLTKSPNERLVLNSFRMVGGQLGCLLMNVMAFPLVAFLGAGDDKTGFLLTAALFGTISVLLQFYAFFHLKEQDVENLEKEPKIPLKDSFKAAKGNWPWIIMVIANLFFWIGMMARNSTVVYYLTYNMGMKDMVAFVNSMASIGILSIIAIPFICKFISKRNTWIIGLVLAAAGEILIFIGGLSLNIMIAGWIISNLGSMIACSMPFAMLGSAVDYGEYKTGIRSAGFLTAFGSTFCIKAGSGIGTAVSAWIMAAFGYIPKQIQSAQGLEGIMCAFIWFPVVMFLMGIIPLIFYKKYESMESKIRLNLIKKEKLS